MSGRYARFLSEKPAEKYDDLLHRVKAAVPYIRNVRNSKIRVAYKDLVCLLQLLRAAPQDNLVLREAFGNVDMAWNGSKTGATMLNNMNIVGSTTSFKPVVLQAQYHNYHNYQRCSTSCNHTDE